MVHKQQQPQKEPESLNDLIGQLRQLFESKQVDIDEVKQLMASYKSKPSDWIDYAQFNEFRYANHLCLPIMLTF